eukprot:73261-Hanusia_phi.AAC.2
MEKRREMGRLEGEGVRQGREEGREGRAGGGRRGAMDFQGVCLDTGSSTWLTLKCLSKLVSVLPSSREFQSHTSTCRDFLLDFSTLLGCIPPDNSLQPSVHFELVVRGGCCKQEIGPTC